MSDGDIETDYDDASGTYTAISTTPIQGSSIRKHAVRVVIQEDRVLPVKYQWFCDRTTEKTVSLSVSMYKVCVEVLVFLKPFYSTFFLRTTFRIISLLNE